MGAGTYTFTGDFAGSSNRPHGVSANGALVVGDDTTGGAYIWNGTTLSYLGTLGGAGSVAYGISANGTFVVGKAQTAGSIFFHAFLWTVGTGMVDLHSLGTSSEAHAVSNDGSVVVGEYNTSGGGPSVLAFRWTASGMTSLGSFGGISSATDVSDDGTVIVGYSYTLTPGQFRAFRWADGTMADIGSLAGPSGSSEAFGVSGDGKVIVGDSTVVGGNRHAFRWANGTMADIGTLGGTYSGANATSGDGSVIVGAAYDASETQRAFVWNAAAGMRSVQDLLTGAGVDTTGWSLTSASAVSADGTVIAGTGTNPSSTSIGWIVRCSFVCGMISSDTIGQSFSGQGALTGTAATYLGSQFDAAGQMADAGKDNPITGFASGAFDSDPTTSASIGATYNLGNDLVIGGTLGAAGILTNTPYNGSATFSGPSATVFVASRPDEGANWLIGGSLVGLSGTVTRGYLNGNTPVTSTGSSTGTGAAFTAQAGWTFKDLVADTLVTPFVSATLSSVSYAGYTETGGPFPATFSAFSATAATFRFGAEGRYAFAKDSVLTARVAYAHTFGSGSTITGAIPGVLALSVPGASSPTDMLEAGIGIDLPIRDKIRANARLGVTLPFTGSPSLQASAGVSMAF